MDLTMMERVGDRWEKMEGSCSTGQSPPWAVVPVEEEGEILPCPIQFTVRNYCSINNMNYVFDKVSLKMQETAQKIKT
jgi:hypothetical protein